MDNQWLIHVGAFAAEPGPMYSGPWRVYLWRETEIERADGVVLSCRDSMDFEFNGCTFADLPEVAARQVLTVAGIVAQEWTQHDEGHGILRGVGARVDAP